MYFSPPFVVFPHLFRIKNVGMNVRYEAQLFPFRFTFIKTSAIIVNYIFLYLVIGWISLILLVRIERSSFVIITSASAAAAEFRIIVVYSSFAEFNHVCHLEVRILSHLWAGLFHPAAIWGLK